MTKILSPYWVKDKVMESLRVATAERYARLQWEKVNKLRLSPCATEGVLSSLT